MPSGPKALPAVPIIAGMQLAPCDKLLSDRNQDRAQRGGVEKVNLLLENKITRLDSRFENYDLTRSMDIEY